MANMQRGNHRSENKAKSALEAIDRSVIGSMRMRRILILSEVDVKDTCTREGHRTEELFTVVLRDIKLLMGISLP